MLGNLGAFKPFPAEHTENGHASALRTGRAFSFDSEIVALAPAGVSVVRFLTGDKAVVFEGGDMSITQEEVLFEVHEDVTFTAPGAVTTAYARNMNRELDIATQLLFYDAPTIDTDGAVVLHQNIKGAAGQNVNRPGFGSGGQDVTTLLKANTEHIFRITNNSALAVDIESHLYYREVNAKEYN